MRLLFDLDGTLTNPFVGITRCIRHALESLGVPVPAAGDLSWCIGPPLRESLKKLLGNEDDELVDRALALYRERFADVGMYENEAYPGVVDCLRKISGMGFEMSVATSKAAVYAEKIIEHFELSKFFVSVDGPDLDGRLGDKTSLIAHVLKRDGLTPDSVVMIGDREHDIMGAVNNGVLPIGVLWGFGSEAELREAGAKACVASFDELRDLVVGMP